MELKLSIEHHDLEAAEALVSMSFWGQKLHVPRPLTPTSDSCDSIHLQPEGGDVAKDLISLSSLVRHVDQVSNLDVTLSPVDLLTTSSRRVLAGEPADR